MSVNVMNSEQLKKRFCKDYNISIAIFKEPYFTERLNLINIISPNVLDNYNIFCEEVSKFNSEQDYFEYYNSVKESVINSIKNNPAYIKFNNDNFPNNKVNINKNDVYKVPNIGKYFISIDMKKANFSALSHYDNNIFNQKKTWEEFISQFTDQRHIINSKYIRQVIMGALNPGRQVKYEQYLMEQLYNNIIYSNNSYMLKPVAFCSDELVFEVAEYDINFVNLFLNNILNDLNYTFCRIEPFKLEQAPIEGYIKVDYFTNELTFKCIGAENYHLVIKSYYNLPITANDKVFMYNGKLATFLE